jgi:hypothetical protein
VSYPQRVKTCRIKRRDEEFVVEDRGGSATVKDERGTVATISHSSGRFNVSLPNGWSIRCATMDSAIGGAVDLCIEYRSQLTAEDAAKEITKFVSECKGDG